VIAALWWLWPRQPEEPGRWVKYAGNPVLGGDIGTVFDMSVLWEEDTYRMWFSWRPKASVALAESSDGVHWSEPQIVLLPNESSGWEDRVNRPVVLRRPDGYHMWYTGQNRRRSYIGYATSPDGISWNRISERPVLSPELPWEKEAVMVPHVLWDSSEQRYKMWYSGGDQYEPDAIGYAESRDGLTWSKRPDPVLTPVPASNWESTKVTGGQVQCHEGWYIMFYIGFSDVDHAQIGLARSRNGITDWQRLPANPIIPAGQAAAWDADAVYKPYAVLRDDQWLLWFNGRQQRVEQIGMATHAGSDLGFGSSWQERLARVLVPGDNSCNYANR